MQNPCNYKTRYGLYRATMRALDQPGMQSAWFVTNALWHCEKIFPDLLPQLRQLISDGAPETSEDLYPVGP